MSKELIEAAKKGDLESIQRLVVKVVDKNAKDGETGLLVWHVAKLNGHQKASQFLFDQGFSQDVNNKDLNGNTPLMLAATKGDAEVIKYILGCDGVEINLVNEWGYSALQKATFNNHLAIAQRLLLEKGIDVGCKPEDKEIFFALHNGDFDQLKKLVVTKETANIVDTMNKSLLCYVASLGNTEAIKLLLEQGAEVGAKNNQGDTPLHIAALSGHTEAIKLLLERGTELGAKTNQGFTPLHIAAQNGHTEAIKLLLEQGAEVGEKTQGFTPLHIAAYNGHTEAIKLLLEQGAEVGVVDIFRKTALQRAKEKAGTGDEAAMEIVKAISSATLADDLLTGENNFSKLDDANNIDLDFDLIQSKCKIALSKSSSLTSIFAFTKNVEKNPYLKSKNDEKAELLEFIKEVATNLTQNTIDLFRLDGKTPNESDSKKKDADNVENTINLQSALFKDILFSDSGKNIICELRKSVTLEQILQTTATEGAAEEPQSPLSGEGSAEE
ncbi:MAG: ankyrin repeat domain-containing protein [Rickettsiaceae bacterium]|nr:ankyrin repeat domain-containing protein [Rickettsiaceae bacterium]